jgi:predicted Holliday junction resolvase-like endonuclease
MAKVDLDSLNVEELVALRDKVNDKLAEKVAARQAELEAELEKLSQYGKPAKKSQPVAAKARKSGEVKNKGSDDRSDEVKEGNGELNGSVAVAA